MAQYNPLGTEAGYSNIGGIYVPTGVSLKETKAKTMMVAAENWGALDLRRWVQYQLQQSRKRYYIYLEMYRRDTWVRATIDYIVRRVTRDNNRLVDLTDPLNPDIEELQTWLDTAYPDGDFTDIYERITRDILIFAQAYVEIERDGAGNPVHLWPMDSRITFPVADLHGSIIGHAQVVPNTNEVVWYSPDEVLYFPVNNNASDVNGISTMETLYDSVAMELQANRYNVALFENNLNIGAVFSMQGLTPDDVEENRKYLVDNYAGPENAYLPLLLSGDAKMLRDGATALKDLNFEILIRVARHRVSAVFGVPESLLGIPDNTNKSTANTHERDTYVNTIRPLRRRINRRFTQQFIRRVWGSTDISLEEPLNSLLPTQGEIEAVAKAAEVGLMYNDILEMLGMPRVPNGDYFVMKIPGAGGYVRLDQTAMPGLGDLHFDFVAYQMEHEAQTAQATAMTQNGMPPAPAAQTYIPPRPQDQIQLEPIAARIIDISRAEDSRAPLGYISRRMPMSPGTRGSQSVYITSGGKPRYGTPPKGKPAPVGGSQGPADDNTMTNPVDVPTPARLSDDERMQVAAARTQISTFFRQAQAENWDNTQFMGALTEAGWEPPPEAPDAFSDASVARSEARRLGEAYPDKTYVLLGKDGQYFLMQNDTASFASQPSAPKEQGKFNQANSRSGTGTPTPEKKSKADTGNPSPMRADNPGKSEKTDTGNPPKMQRSMGDDWTSSLRTFIGESF